MHILVSLEHAPNTVGWCNARDKIHSNTLVGPWLHTLENGNAAPACWSVVHEHCMLDCCFNLDRTAHDICLELGQRNLGSGTPGADVHTGWPSKEALLAKDVKPLD